jgi:hypothetical protein
VRLDRDLARCKTRVDGQELAEHGHPDHPEPLHPTPQTPHLKPETRSMVSKAILVQEAEASEASDDPGLEGDAGVIVTLFDASNCRKAFRMGETKEPYVPRK